MYRYIELWGFYDTICNAFYRVMARNNEKNPREITVCGSASIYLKYFFQTKTKIFYKSLRSFVTSCFCLEITYCWFIIFSIPQSMFLIRDHIFKVHSMLNPTMHVSDQRLHIEGS